MTYAEKLKHPKWQRKRLEILQRDEFTCLKCRSTLKTLHVHHLSYSKGDPWDIDNSQLVTVCYECHAKEHGKKEPEKYNEVGNYAVVYRSVQPRMLLVPEATFRIFNKLNEDAGKPIIYTDIYIGSEDECLTFCRNNHLKI